MIEVLLKGRLGNWLFQYAAGRVLSLKHHVPLRIDVSEQRRLRDPLGLAAARALRFYRTDACYSSMGNKGRCLQARLGLRERPHVFREQAWGYDPLFSGLGDGTRLIGYFQSARYWEGFQGQIRAELVPRHLPEGHEFRAMLDAIQDCNAVSVHIRRTDYLVTQLNNVCSPEYFERALNWMRERLDAPVFFLFSDDLPWCRNRFCAPDIVPVDLPGALEAPMLDLHLMSRCRHHIVSNSTFSWWGSWMNASPGKRVVAPERWFTDEEMNRLAMRDTVPAEWERIPC